MKCANCDRDALWVYESPASDDLPFCDSHLPSFLRKAAKSGVLTRTEHYQAMSTGVLAALAPAPETAPKRRKKADPVVDETVAEEPVAEDVVVEPVEA